MRLRASYNAALASLALSGQPALAQDDGQNEPETTAYQETSAVNTDAKHYGGPVVLLTLGAAFALTGWRQRRKGQDPAHEHTTDPNSDNEPPLIEVKPTTVLHAAGSRHPTEPIRHQPAGDKPEPVEV